MYYKILYELRDAGTENSRGKFDKRVMLLHDNALANTTHVAQDAFRAHSPDLAPSDYYAFRYLTKHLRQRRFFDDIELAEYG